MRLSTLSLLHRLAYPLSLLAVVLFSCKMSGKTGSENKDLPNIILIVSDDQGYNDIGVYGSEEIITPNLDRLAKEGMQFTNFYVTCSVCTPSRGGMLTGRYPQRNGIYENIRNNRVDDGHVYDHYEYSTSPERILGLDIREILFPQLLHKAGYINGIFGKWDLGQLNRFLPLQRGFDRFYGFVNTGIDYYTHERYSYPSMYRDNVPTSEDKGTYATDLFEREAIRFIKENRENPFFLYLPFNAPHGASNLDPDIRGTVQAPPEFLSMYPDAVSKQDQRRKGYMAAVTCMDEAIGNILNLVDSLDLANNTLVIFFSDNGGSSIADNSPLTGKKGTMWEGGLRVPCMMKWPGKIAPGRITDNFISSLEIFPTILDITGIDKPDSLILDGFSIYPFLKGEKELEREEMYWDFREESAARIGNWKWISSEKRKKNNGFFDLSADIAERNDLSGKKPEELKMIQTSFRKWQKEMEKAEPRGPFRNY